MYVQQPGMFYQKNSEISQAWGLLKTQVKSGNIKIALVDYGRNLYQALV